MEYVISVLVFIAVVLVIAIHRSRKAAERNEAYEIYLACKERNEAHRREIHHGIR